MNKDKEHNQLVPELRFSEFDEDWENEPFSKVYSFKITNSFSRNKLNYEEGEVKNIHYGDIHTKFSTLFSITKECVPFINQDVPIDRIDEENYCVEGDIVIADASEDLGDIGKSIEIVNLNNERLLAGLHTFLARQIEPKLIIGFGGHLFKSKGIRKQIKREAQGSKVLGISKGRISSIEIYYPKDKKEQQKIAATLTSLDNLIAAENEKLEALQAHKKGLLQQLFPAKGEKVPKVRFGEFSGEWEETTLSKLGKLVNGLTYKPEDTREKGLLVLRSSNVREGLIDFEDCVFVRTDIKGANLSKPNDILICVRNGSKRLIGKNALIPKEMPVSTHGAFMTVFRANSPKFIFQLFQTADYNRQVKADLGATINSINGKNFLKYKFRIPKDANEQQKIANCLSSLDALIAAQSEKIEALKEHKKGLMQQLFPNLNMKRS